MKKNIFLKNLSSSDFSDPDDVQADPDTAVQILIFLKITTLLHGNRPIQQLEIQRLLQNLRMNRSK
jgi:hypothetical protein